MRGHCTSLLEGFEASCRSRAGTSGLPGSPPAWEYQTDPLLLLWRLIRITPTPSMQLDTCRVQWASLFSRAPMEEQAGKRWRRDFRTLELIGAGWLLIQTTRAHSICPQQRA